MGQQALPFRPTGRVVCRWSAGAASAFATWLALQECPDAEIYYNETGQHHVDNERFRMACAELYGKPVCVLSSRRYKDAFEVWEGRKWIVSHDGTAACTGALKRIPGDAVWRIGDTEVFGYTADEAKRVERFRRDNPERNIWCPLIDQGVSKDDCFRWLESVGIELPTMYKLGFRNNNCIACCKARDSIDYWKRIRKHFPGHFERMARLERQLGFQINRVSRNGVRVPIYLDEIDPGDPKGADPKISCGLFCGIDEEAASE